MKPHLLLWLLLWLVGGVGTHHTSRSVKGAPSQADEMQGVDVPFFRDEADSAGRASKVQQRCLDG